MRDRFNEKKEKENTVLTKKKKESYFFSFKNSHLSCVLNSMNLGPGLRIYKRKRVKKNVRKTTSSRERKKTARKHAALSTTKSKK